MPAAVTRKSSRPKRLAQNSTTRSRSHGSAASSLTAATLVSVGSTERANSVAPSIAMSAMTTFAPASAKRRVIARPMPPFAPVNSKTRREKSNNCLLRWLPRPVARFPESMGLEFKQLDDDAVGIPDIAREAAFHRTGHHARDLPLFRRARRDQRLPGPDDVVYFQADMGGPGQGRRRCIGLDRAVHILDEFDVMAVAVKMGNHERCAGDAGG